MRNHAFGVTKAWNVLKKNGSSEIKEFGCGNISHLKILTTPLDEPAVKEEKKNRIKMEISRRRNQIEENARLHEELIRLGDNEDDMGLGDYNTR